MERARYILYNNDVPAASFELGGGTVQSFCPLREELLPKQLLRASADGFTLWLQARAIDLNTFQHRQLAQALTGSRDKTSIAIAAHMFSISDTFTCFAEGTFIPRGALCSPREQERVSDFILVSSDTSLRQAGMREGGMFSPNLSTDGSFTKTWRFEEGEWWLYKLQPPQATVSECEISKVLIASGFDAAEYRYCDEARTRIRTRNFVGAGEFFEPYDSLRFMFEDKSDEEEVIYRNLASLGDAMEAAWRRILLADALFMNTDRHMRNFGVIRSAATGEILRLAPNFDNNQAYKANPGGRYSGEMLRDFMQAWGLEARDRTDLRRLLDACGKNPYLEDAAACARDAMDKR